MRPVFDLVTKITEFKSCQELSSLNWFHFEELWFLLIIVRSSPILMLAWETTLGETDEKMANVIVVTDDQFCTSLLDRVG